ncbi:hypothetical protein B0H19DRAFT_1073856 [Mycena capillaripes]|nr:hypothetical protein B0H19DRAFT_1073856 [Mycena capillaripes]
MSTGMNAIPLGGVRGREFGCGSAHGGRTHEEEEAKEQRTSLQFREPWRRKRDQELEPGREPNYDVASPSGLIGATPVAADTLDPLFVVPYSLGRHPPTRRAGTLILRCRGKPDVYSTSEQWSSTKAKFVGKIAAKLCTMGWQWMNTILRPSNGKPLCGICNEDTDIRRSRGMKVGVARVGADGQIGEHAEDSRKSSWVLVNGVPVDISLQQWTVTVTEGASQGRVTVTVAFDVAKEIRWHFGGGTKPGPRMPVS